jgi:flagellar basal body-associated protein FliL
MSKKAVLIIVILVVFGIIAAVVYFFMASNKKDTETIKSQQTQSSGVGNILANSNPGIITSLLGLIGK